MLKIYLKDIGYMLGTIVVGLFLFTLLNYFNIFNDKITNFIKIILPIGVFIFGGWNLARNTNKRGIVEGLKIGSIILGVFLLISLLVINSGFKWQNLIYYLILLISSITGGIIAKQKKDK